MIARLLYVFLLPFVLAFASDQSRAAEPKSELAKRLAGVTFDRYAEAPGYSESKSRDFPNFGS